MTMQLGSAWWPAGYNAQFIPPPPNPYACPLVPLVGACCAGCAAGGACSGADELEHSAAVAEMLDKKAVVGILGGDAAVPWSEVEKTNGVIDHMQESAAPLASAPAGTPENRRWMLWSVFYATWHVWYLATKAALEDQVVSLGPRFIAAEQAETYASLVVSFNEQLKALQAAKVADVAAPIDTRSPAAKAFDGLVDQTTGALGGVAGALTTVVSWIAIVGAVGLAAYFGVPVLIARFAR